MGRKLHICKGKACKNAGSYKLIKGWAVSLDIGVKLKKSKCLGKCKETYAVEFNDEVFTCKTQKQLERIIKK
jgi:NADH:ubiquinone oxidoreductase subunit E